MLGGMFFRIIKNSQQQVDAKRDHSFVAIDSRATLSFA